jgi:hypothetical protein
MVERPNAMGGNIHVGLLPKSIETFRLNVEVRSVNADTFLLIIDTLNLSFEHPGLIREKKITVEATDVCRGF